MLIGVIAGMEDDINDKFGVLDGRQLFKHMDEIFEAAIKYGKKIRQKQCERIIIETLSEHKRNYEIIHTDELFKQDCNKYHPSKEGKSFLYNIQSECYVKQPRGKGTEWAEKYIQDHYGINTLNMYKSYNNKIVYRVYTMVRDLYKEHSTVTDILAIVDTLGTQAHERQHAQQSEKMKDTSAQIQFDPEYGKAMQDLSFRQSVQYLLTSEYDAIVQQVTAMKKYMQNNKSILKD